MASSIRMASASGSMLRVIQGRAFALQASVGRPLQACSFRQIATLGHSSGVKETSGYCTQLRGGIQARTTDPAAAYHPVFSTQDDDQPTQAYVVRFTGELADGSHVYEHVPVSVPKPVEAQHEYAVMTAEIAERMKQLRASDPLHWTQRRLATEFNVRWSDVVKAARAPEWRLAEHRAKMAARAVRKSRQAEHFARKQLRRRVVERFKG